MKLLRREFSKAIITQDPFWKAYPLFNESSDQWNVLQQVWGVLDKYDSAFLEKFVFELGPPSSNAMSWALQHWFFAVLRDDGSEAGLVFIVGAVDGSGHYSIHRRGDADEFVQFCLSALKPRADEILAAQAERFARRQAGHRHLAASHGHCNGTPCLCPLKMEVIE